MRDRLRGVRLAEIEVTAAAIADGDLSQRVERAEPRTEVGRLGLSLNAMLTQMGSQATEDAVASIAIEAPRMEG